MLTHSRRLWLLIIPVALALLLSLFLVLLLALPASAGDTTFRAETTTIRYVAPGGSDSSNDCTNSATPCATIQHAIDIAGAGEEVRVAAGTYDQVQVKTSNQGYTFTQVAYIDKGLTLRGGFTPGDWNTADPANNVTVLDAQGHGRGVTIFDTGDALATVDGFTITNGDYTGLGNPDDQDNLSCNRAGEDCGGGLFGKDSVITLKNLLITNNIASRDEGDGGGIYLISARTVTIENTQVISNIAEFGAGGGIFVLWQRYYPLIIQDSLFQDNIAYSYGGLALRDFRIMVTIDRTDFLNNVATNGDAGGLYIRPAVQNARLELDRVKMIGNQAKSRGKAIYIDSSGSTTNMEVHFSNMVLAGNSNTPGNTPAAEDATVVAYARGTTLDLDLSHVTAAGNPVSNFLYVLSNNDPGERTSVQISNTLVTNFDYAFAAEEENDGTVVITHTNSLLYEIGLGEYSNLGGAPSFSGSATVTGNPLLNNSYHLTDGSAAIDSGVETGITHDIDGDERPYGDLPDIGADEFTRRYVYLPTILR